VMSTNVRRAIIAFAPDTRLHHDRSDVPFSIVVSFTVALLESGSRRFSLGPGFQENLQGWLARFSPLARPNRQRSAMRPPTAPIADQT
jgi:hypothetical protein